MAELKNELVLDAGGFNQSMNDATKNVESFDKASKKASDSIKDLGDKGALSTKDLLKEIGKLSGAERSVSNYRRQLAQMTKDISDLTIAYRAMNSEQQNSDLGRQMLQRINDLTQKAGQYKDAIMDVQQNIKNLASDTMYWDAAAQGINMVTGAMQICSAVSLITGKNTDQLVKTLSKIKALENSARAFKNITNALQKQSSLLSTVRNLQDKLTRSINLSTAATGRMTIAQRLLNKVAAANPYVLLAAAAVAVGTAIYAWTKHTKEQEKEQEKLNKEVEEGKKQIETFAGEISPLLNKFLDLTDGYRKLNNNKDKLNFLKTHAEDFKALGLAVKDLNDAENILINNTEKFKQAIIKRGVIQGLQKMIEQETNKAAEKIAELYKEAGPYKEGQRLTYDQLEKLGHGGADVYRLAGRQQEGPWGPQSTTVELTGEGADLLNKEVLKRKEDQLFKDLEESRGRIQEVIDRYTEEISGILDLNIDAGGSGGGGKNTPIDEKAIEGSLTWLQSEYSKELKKLQGMKLEDPGFDEQKDKVLALYNLIEQIKDKYQIGVKVDTGDAEKKTELVAGSLAEAQYHVNELSKILNNMDPKDEDFEEIVELLDIWKNRQKEINDLINGTSDEVKDVETELDKLLSKYNDITSSASNIQKLFDIGAIDAGTARKMLSDLNKKLAKEGITVPITLEISDLREFKNKFDKLSDVAETPIDAIKSIGDSYKSMMDKLEDPKADGWEQFWSVISFGETVISTVSSLLGVMATVEELVAAAKDKAAMATVKDTAAEAASIPVKEAAAGASITEGAAEGLVAATKGAKSIADIPIVGWVLAGVALATILAGVIAAISTVKGFADGGIVGGNSYTGDKILARLNSGELILNRDQQNDLWKQMNSNTKNMTTNESSYGGISIPDKITLTAKGQDLQAVLINNQKRGLKI